MNSDFGKIKLTIEYDGTNYQGWQRQADGVPTIQGEIENALETLFEQKLALIGAGRTDSGVHAKNQVAHFSPPREVGSYNLIHAFQSLLPADIVVKKAERVSSEFHAQNDAVSKTYVYRIWNEPAPSALRSRYSLWIRQPLDLVPLNRACGHIIGEQDFNCFRSEGSAVKTTVRTINRAEVINAGEYVEFRVNGSGFLKQMVRNMMGTLLQIQLNGRDPDSIPSLINSRDRQKAGPAVPSQGLYLEQIFYRPSSRGLDNSPRLQ